MVGNQNPNPNEKTIAVVLSPMRSGSTLLKALLAVPDDVSDLPETNFQRFPTDTDPRLLRLAPEPILVLKRPCWFTEIGVYPKIPSGPNVKRIVLARDCYEVVSSVKRMALRSFHPFIGWMFDDYLINHYWAGVYDRLTQMSGPNTHIVRYEDLVDDPIKHTAELFAFIGSAHKEGIDGYNQPGAYSWKWGQDDGSDRIKSLKVCSRKKPRVDLRLLKRIQNSPRVAEIQARLNYQSQKSRETASSAEA